ncbi:unnamed protein product [Paramecium octaurelia]|uniref:Receptor expression-enhancing protein n=1 Tax=Paramecium octaurelia TaxID=43137 RepID=A0A8S1UYW9_PAROT|nr:unnamed protein product [Paramecium octaurelia]
MNIVLSKLDPLITKFGLDNTDQMEILKGPCSKIGVRPAHVVFIAGSVALFSILFGIAARFLSTFISIIYPAYRSIQAIESSGENDDKQWLTYWILFSIITLADASIGFALEFIPFYHILKLALFVALFHPQVKGAEKLYDQFVHPLYLKHHEKIDKGFQKVQEKVKQQVNDKFQN